MIYIHSPNVFDETALRIMGLSAKVNDNSIGRFGTGLKYAVAIILRNGGSLTIQRRSAPAITFRTSDSEFRGKSFTGIEMNCGKGWEPLPFTTDYGRDWELWKAYRELVSNAYDEGGDVSDSLIAAETVFEVEGLAEPRQQHDSIFLAHERKKFFSHRELEIDPEPSSVVYYRNIRAAQLSESLPCRINILGEIKLTEDRTIASEYVIRTIVAYHVLRDMTEAQIETVFRSRLWDKLNCGIYYNDITSAAFMNVARTSAFVPNNVASWLSRKNEESNQFRERSLSASEQNLVSAAMTIVRKIMPDAEQSELTFVAKLVDTCGLYDTESGKCYIAATTFGKGRDHLAATIYEELCHKHYGYRDESRSFQEHLLQTLIGFASRN